MKNKNKKLLIIPIMIFSIIGVLVIAGVTKPNNEFRFGENIYINGESVRGMTRDKAEKVVSQKLNKEIQESSIDLKYGDKTWHFSGDELKVNDAVKQVVNKAYNTWLTDKEAFKAVMGGNFKVSFTSIYDEMNANINDIIKQIEKEPINSEVIFKPNEEPMFTITKSEKGKKVDVEKLYSELENKFLKEKNIEIEIPIIEIEPEKDEKYFENKTRLMGEFSTDLKNSQAGRKHNVEFALSKFNGKVVKAKETVSFNEVTSPQTLEAGYQKATVILNGVFTQGVGGGICQASTTLYNACLLANMQIEEVHKHTLPVGYVELSLDAMVSEGYADFIFTNTSDDDIYIKTYVEGDRAYAKIYGNSIEEGVTITREAEFVGNIPHRGDKIVPDTNKEYTNKVIYKGEYYRLKYPREGYEAKAYKNYYKNGELIKREQIRHEKYQPLDGVIIEGVEDLPEGFKLPQSDVEIIKPQTIASNTSKTIAKKIKTQNPTRYAL